MLGEIQSYRDPRLQPMDAEERPVDWYEDCIHARACLMQACRLDPRLEIVDDARVIASALGCGEDCECYDEDDTADLRRVVKQLIETVKVGEAECDCALMAHRLKADLRMLGFEV